MGWVREGEGSGEKEAGFGNVREEKAQGELEEVSGDACGSHGCLLTVPGFEKLSFGYDFCVTVSMDKKFDSARRRSIYS